MSKVEQKQAARSGGGIAMSCLDEQDKITIENEQVLPDGGHEHHEHHGHHGHHGSDGGHEHHGHHRHHGSDEDHEHHHHHGSDEGHEHHGHHGHHTHDIPADGPADRNVVLLRYMYDHNMHHAEELVELAAALRAEGREKAAGLIDEALNAYRSGNELLSKALSECGEG